MAQWKCSIDTPLVAVLIIYFRFWGVDTVLYYHLGVRSSIGIWYLYERVGNCERRDANCFHRIHQDNESFPINPAADWYLLRQQQTLLSPACSREQTRHPRRHSDMYSIENFQIDSVQPIVLSPLCPLRAYEYNSEWLLCGCLHRKTEGMMA